MTILNISSPGGPLQQFTVQWNVAGSLDGSTIAPGLRTTNGIIAGDQQDEDNVFQIDVAGDAGLFDPDALGQTSGYGDRYIQWIFIESGGANIPMGFQVEIVDASGIDPNLGIVVLDDIGATQTFGTSTMFYLSEMHLVPLGALLRLRGLPDAPVGSPHHVKLGIYSAMSGREDAELESNWCCQRSLEAADDGGGGGDGQTLQSREFYSFSQMDLTMGGELDEFYFGFSGGQNVPSDPPLTGTILATSGLAHEKLIIRPGAVTGLVLRSDTGITVQPFVDISVGNAAFARTPLTVAPVVVAANTNVAVSVTSVEYDTNSRIRVGFEYGGPGVTIALSAEVEITTPE